MAKNRVDVQLSISEHGISKASINGSTAVEQQAAHVLLAAIVPAIRELHQAILRVKDKQ